MTFAAKASTLLSDKKVFYRWTSTRHPYDFELFTELKIIKRRRLISPIPSYSTHGEVAFLANYINWEVLANE